MFRVLSKAILLSTLVVIISCGQQSKDEDESSVLKAQRLVDLGRSEEAIYLLEHLNAAESGDGKAIAVLASAYASRAKIEIKSFLPMIKRIKDGLVAPQKSSGQNGLSDQSFFIWIDKVRLVVGLYSDIPTVKDSDHVFLEQAIATLEKIAYRLPEEAVFHALLQIVEFKYVLSKNEGLLGSVACSSAPLDPSQTQNVLKNLSAIVYSVIEDMGVAYPSKSASVKLVLEQFATTQQTLASTYASLQSSEETARLTSMLTKYGFDGLLTCGN